MLIVDCGGITVNLTTCHFEDKFQLDKITKHFDCGSTSIDKEFIEFLRKKLGTHTIDLFIENHSDQFQYLVQNFCRRIKIPFTGDDTVFSYELDIEEIAPSLKQYLVSEIREIMEDDDWVIEINHNDIKKMFDPVIERIL